MVPPGLVPQPVKPPKGLLVRIFNKVVKTLIGSKRYKWDKEYASGRWDYFNDALQVSRYEAVLQFVDGYAGKRTILELGCGEGILQARMRPGSYERFLGIDISKVAIRKASLLKDRSTDYKCGDMEKFVPSGKFSLLIFNEVLNYSDDPVRLLTRYTGFLEPNGLVICSFFETEHSLQIMRDIERRFPVIGQKLSVNQRGVWHCKVYSKP